MTIIVLVISNVFWIASAGYWFLKYLAHRRAWTNELRKSNMWERAYWESQ